MAQRASLHYTDGVELSRVFRSEQANCMAILRIYFRVLGMLGAEKRLAIMLIAANLALAVAQFAEPVLFGRIIDALTGGNVNSFDVNRDGVLDPFSVAYAASGFGRGNVIAKNTTGYRTDALGTELIFEWSTANTWANKPVVGMPLSMT